MKKLLLILLPIILTACHKTENTSIGPVKEKQIVFDSISFSKSDSIFYSKISDTNYIHFSNIKPILGSTASLVVPAKIGSVFIFDSGIYITQYQNATCTFLTMNSNSDIVFSFNYFGISNKNQKLVSITMDYYTPIK